MNEEMKKILIQSIKDLKTKGGSDLKPVISRLEKLVKSERRVKKGLKQA